MTDRVETMRAFVAVCDGGSFTAAATLLGVAVSTVTRSVTDLEGRLGVQLLQRTTRAIRRTEAGAVFLDEARAIVSLVDNVEATVRDYGSAIAGRLKVSAPVMFGRLHACRVIADHMAAHAAAEVELHLANTYAALIEERVDLAIRIGALTDSGLRCFALGNVRPVYAANPRYLEEHGVPMHPSDLHSHQLIAYQRASTGSNWSFRIDGEHVDLPVSPRFSSNSSEAAVEVASQGGGIVAAMDFQIALQVSSGSLVEVLQPFGPAVMPIQIVLPHTRHVTAGVRSLIDAFRKAKHRWTAAS